MKRIKHGLSLLLVLCLCLSMIPIRAQARTTITTPGGASGSNYSVAYAGKLDNIFQGNVALFSNSSDKYALGQSMIMDRSYSVASTISGKQCYIYANAVYYYLFGDIPCHGSGISGYWKDSRTVLTNQSSASYDSFRNAGVGFGAYIRTTGNSDGSYNGGSGHSMIVLSYDANTITILEGNANGKGLVRITNETWNEFNSSKVSGKGWKICHVVQCNSAGTAGGAIPANLGDDFYAPILNKEHWKIIENNNGSVQTADENGKANQLWRFQRQSDGSYKISNCQDGRCLDVADASSESGAQVWLVESNDTDAQRWYIYEESGGYILRAKCTNCVLDLPYSDPTNGNKLQMFTRHGEGNQIWAIYRGDECQLKSPTLSVQVGTSSTATRFTWNEVYGERCYDLKIWRDTLWEGDPYYLQWGAISGHEVVLPAGTYHAYVDAGHEFECKMSNVVTFTVATKTHPMIRLWMSDSEYGDSVTDFKVGNRYYFCYRLYDKISGKDWDEVADYDYTAKLTIYKPDGSVLYSCDPVSSDTYWISCFYKEPGVYTREIILEGDFEFSDAETFTVADDPMQMEASTSSVHLTLGGTESTVINAWTTGYHSTNTVLSWNLSNSNISCSWGEWTNGLLPLTITANSVGTTTITLSVKEKDTKTVLDTYTVNVTVDAKNYTISYNANGGSGAPGSQTKQHGKALVLSSTKPTRFGYNFIGWATSASATTAAYQPGGKFTTDANTTLYAVWSAAETISTTTESIKTPKARSGKIGYYYKFTPNVSTSFSMNLFDIGEEGAVKITLYDSNKNVLKQLSGTSDKFNCTLEYVVTSGSTYYLYLEFTDTDESDVYFVVSRGYRLTYNANGGSNAPAQEYYYYGSGYHTISATIPVRTGYTFVEWNTKSDGSGHAYGPSDPLDEGWANVTLYAIWKTGCSGSHHYSYKVTKYPTVSAAGTLTGKCDDCDAISTVTLPKLDTTNYTYKVTKEPTCTAAGTGRYTWKTTTYGSFYFDVSIAAKGHSYTSTVTAPTCTEQGYTTHTCACGHSYKDNYTPATGHSYTYKATKNPTTSATGTLTGTCSRCSGTTTVTLPKLDTTNYTYKVTKEPTCTATGTGRYTWKTTTYGSFYFDVSIAAKGHTYTSQVTAPTCTAQGYTTHTCQCGHSFVDSYVNALGHDMGKWTVVNAATCTKAGSERRDCSRCDHYETRNVSATGHSYEPHVTAPTCTVGGYTQYICAACGSSYTSDYTDATGHDHKAKVTAATCTSQGYTTYTCHCGDSYVSDYTNALGHDMGNWITVTEATCTENGQQIQKCSRCDHRKARTTEALGHAWDDGAVTIEPTEDTEGEMIYTCERCGLTRTEVIPALDHEHRYDAIVTAPTCTKQGYTTHTCDCGHSFVDTYVDALGHDMGRWFTISDATCTEDGLEQCDCSRCDYCETREISASGHTYKPMSTAPTCTNMGFTTHTCHCGDSYTDSYIDPLGHSFTVYASDGNATCTQDGTKTAVCDRCDIKDTVIDEGSARGHDFTEWTVIQKPTVTSEGLEFRYCLICGIGETRHVAWSENPFTDVPEGSFYYEPVLWAVENGITNGATATTFDPGGTCLRAHVVTFLHRADGNPEPSSSNNPFSDVKNTDFFYKPVLWAVEKGITNGTSETTFGSFANCNRAAVVTFLWRAAGSPEPESTSNPFVDVKTTDFFYKPVLWAAENGITSGIDATHFGPTVDCNRAQVVTFLYRAYN